MGGDCSKYVQLKDKREKEINQIKARYTAITREPWHDPPLPVKAAPKKGPGRMAAMRKKMKQSMSTMKATFATGPPPKGAITMKTAGRYYGNAQAKKHKIEHFTIPDARKHREYKKIKQLQEKVKEYNNIMRRAKAVQEQGIPDPGPQSGGRRRKTPAKRKRTARKRKPTRKKKGGRKRKTRSKKTVKKRKRKVRKAPRKRRRRRVRRQQSWLEWLGLA